MLVAVVHAFFISDTRLKFAKYQAKAKQHPEAKLFLFENYSLSSFMLSSKTKILSGCSIIYVMQRGEWVSTVYLMLCNEN